MNNALDGIYELEGAHGVFLFTDNGTIIQRKVHTLYTDEILQQASRNLMKTIESLKLQLDNWSSFTIQFSDGKILLNNLEEAILAIVSDNRLNEAFAKIAIRVATNQLKKQLKNNEIPQFPEPPENIFTSSAVGAADSTPWGTGSTSTSSNIATPSMAWSGIGSSGMVGATSSVAVLNEASKKFLDQCTRALSQFIGPIAKVIVKKKVRQLTNGAIFSMDNSKPLLKLLEEEIDIFEQKAEFRSLMGMG